MVVRPDPDSGHCEFVQISRPPMWCGDLRGGSQLVPVDGSGDVRWLAIVHGVLAESPRRQYFHAWVGFDARLRLRRVSDPFVLQGLQVEFAAGLVCRGDELLLAWGMNDAEAWLGRIAVDDALGSLGRGA